MSSEGSGGIVYTIWTCSFSFDFNCIHVRWSTGLLKTLHFFYETKRELSALFGITFLLKNLTLFHIRIPIKHHSLNFFIFPEIKSANAYSKRWCHTTISNHMLSNSLPVFHWFVKCCAANFKWASACFFFSSEVLCSFHW